MGRARTPVARISAGDAMQLASDVGPAPLHVGAVLVLGGAGAAGTVPDAGSDGLAAVIARRAATIRRLRQVLVTAPPGLGRPYWVDSPAEPAAQVHVVRCPTPGDRAALLRLAADVVARPLPRSRPLWRAVVVTGLDDGATAVVVALHHVLADGLGGLAVLDRLVDGADAADEGPATPLPAPSPRPRRRDLLADAAAERRGALRRLPATLGGLRRAGREIGVAGPGTAPRSSLTAATGPRRRVATAAVDLEALRTAARRHGATVNDALLVGVTAALGDLLARRGEHVPGLVVSVPVAARAPGSSDAEGSSDGEGLGNAVGVMRVRVPLDGTLAERLAAVAATTRVRRSSRRGASAALVGPAFRLLRALGLFRPLVMRQRLVNAFLTNVRGPAHALTLAGRPVREIVPVTLNAGNVAVAVAALSYAGRLEAAVVVDPELVPELDALAADLGARLRELTRL